MYSLYEQQIHILTIHNTNDNLSFIGVMYSLYEFVVLYFLFSGLAIILMFQSEEIFV